MSEKSENRKKPDPGKKIKTLDEKPDNKPSGDRELSDEELKDVSGGAKSKKTKFPYVY